MSLPLHENFGPFLLLRELGRGATGTVYLAEQTKLGRECALKVLAPELVRDKTFLDRFRREGKIAASLRHKGIVRIFDLVECEQGFALAMDYIEGQELQQLLASDEALPQSVALDIIAHVLDALDYAHKKGVVHRDIKPANILIEQDGSVFLTDFSIARMAGGERLTQTGTIIGTPEYMAPEQFDGKEVDARADVYATSLILYEMLAGINPFAGDTLAEIVKKQILLEPPPLGEAIDASPELVALVHKGLKKTPSERFQSAGEMREALLQLGGSAKKSSGSLTQFLSSVELGAISMDDAVNAREKVKEAIDRGFKRMLTIVMLDLAGSSKIKIPNQTLIADRAFQDYRGTINRILEAHQCERYDWSGDGAIALFPEAVPAVDAAVLVQKTVADVGRRHQSLPDALKVRIGIRTGLVYYDPRRTLGEFASRTVDQAGHLEKDCPPGAIRLGDSTVAAIGDRYKTVSKGMNRDDIEVFEIEVESLSPPVSQPLTKAQETRDMPEQRPQALSAQKEAEPITSPTETISGQLFVPKKSDSGSLPEPTAEKPQTPWWGWRTLGLLAFVWGGILLFNTFLPGAAIPNGPRKFFASAFTLHILFVPVYCIYCAIRGEIARAKEAATAGAAFFIGALVFLFYMTTL